MKKMQHRLLLGDVAKMLTLEVRIRLATSKNLIPSPFFILTCCKGQKVMLFVLTKGVIFSPPFFHVVRSPNIKKSDFVCFEFVVNFVVFTLFLLLCVWIISFFLETFKAFDKVSCGLCFCVSVYSLFGIESGRTCELKRRKPIKHVQ